MVVEQRRAARRSGRRARADPPRGRAQPRPQLAVRGRLARHPRALLGDVVEQDHRPDRLAGVVAHVGLRAAQAAARRSPSQPAGSSSPSKSTKRSSGAPAGRSALRERPRELDDRGGAGRAVVGADEALRPRLDVVVRADDDRRLRARARCRRRCAGRGWSVAERLEAAPRQRVRSRAASRRSAGARRAASRTARPARSAARTRAPRRSGRPSLRHDARRVAGRGRRSLVAVEVEVVATQRRRTRRR